MKARHARRVVRPHALALVSVLLASFVAGGAASGATTAPTFARADYAHSPWPATPPSPPMCNETVSRRSTAATLRLNVLVVFADEMQKNAVYSLPYSDELGEAKRRQVELTTERGAYAAQCHGSA
jgi:hypothetical protein